jgi:hypothetical protein
MGGEFRRSADVDEVERFAGGDAPVKFRGGDFGERG